MNSSTIAILVLILFLTAVTVAYVRLRHWQEGFEEELDGFTNPSVVATPPSANVSSIQKNATFCPPGSKYFVSRRGDSMCCDGPVEKRRCKGRLVCTMSKSQNGVPSCTDVHNSLRAKFAATYCPPSMSNFFASEATGVKGCTSSAITTSGDGPLHADAAKCIIGSTGPEADLENENSCLNVKRKEEMRCLTPNCTKSFIKKTSGAPLVLIQNYTLVDETAPRACTDDDSMQIYLDKTEPGWRSANKPEYDFAVNTQFCGSAKRILVEKRVA